MSSPEVVVPLQRSQHVECDSRKPSRRIRTDESGRSRRTRPPKGIPVGRSVSSPRPSTAQQPTNRSSLMVGHGSDQDFPSGYESDMTSRWVRLALGLAEVARLPLVRPSRPSRRSIPPGVDSSLRSPEGFLRLESPVEPVAAIRGPRLRDGGLTFAAGDAPKGTARCSRHAGTVASPPRCRPAGSSSASVPARELRRARDPFSRPRWKSTSRTMRSRTVAFP
jgi:hypothetical protein